MAEPTYHVDAGLFARTQHRGDLDGAECPTTAAAAAGRHAESAELSAATRSSFPSSSRPVQARIAANASLRAVSTPSKPTSGGIFFAFAKSRSRLDLPHLDKCQEQNREKNHLTAARLRVSYQPIGNLFAAPRPMFWLAAGGCNHRRPRGKQPARRLIYDRRRRGNAITWLNGETRQVLRRARTD